MITVFGSINLDLMHALERLPGAGETLLSRRCWTEPGGKGANQAVAAARDGAAVAMVGAVGRDALAAEALAGLRRAGVDVSGVIAVDGPTGVASVLTDAAGRNAIAVGPGANAAVRHGQVMDERLMDGVVVLQMEVPAAENAALIGRGRGARFVLNLAPAGAMPRDALRAVDVLVVNESEAAWLAGDLGCSAEAAALHAALGVAVVRTLGEDGAEFAGPEGLGTVPARRVAVADTAAAGDCFVGVLAAGLDRGWPLGQALHRAGAAAALCCTRAGTQGSLPVAAETDALLA